MPRKTIYLPDAIYDQLPGNVNFSELIVKALLKAGYVTEAVRCLCNWVNGDTRVPSPNCPVHLDA